MNVITKHYTRKNDRWPGCLYPTHS